ncbi:MAG TPA: hypothetical protein VIQ31_30085 [Phormidium sp.]
MDNLYTFKFNQSETFSALCQRLIDPVEYYEARKERVFRDEGEKSSISNKMLGVIN